VTPGADDIEVQPTPQRFGWQLAAVALAAAALRSWHVFALRRLPLFDQLVIDSRHYDRWAQHIAEGNWLGGDRAFYMDPLYPYALAALYRLVGHDLLAVRLAHVALGVGTCVLVAWTARRFAGTAGGLAAGGLVALYGPLVFEEGEVEKTALGVFLVAAALALAAAEGARARFGAGVCLGLAALTRGNLLLLAPLVALALVVDPGGSGGAPRPSRRRRLSGGVAFAAGFLLALAPVAWRNHHVSGDWVLTASQLGQNLYTGNNPSNATGAYHPVPFVRPTPDHEEADFRAKAELEMGRPLSPSEVSRFYVRKTLAHVAAEPAFAAAVLGRKAALVLADLEIPDGWSFVFLRRFSPALALAAVSFAWLLGLAVVGAAVTVRASPNARLLVGFAACYVVSLVAFFVFSRYRVYLVPPLAALGGAGVAWLVHAGRARAWRSIGVASAAAIAVGAASALAGPGVGLREESFVHDYARLAELHASRGETERAEALFAEALAVQPQAASTLHALGALRIRRGEAARAVEPLEAAVRVNPRFPEVWFTLASAYEAVGRLEDAKAAYWRQLDQNPGHAAALRRLQRLLSPSRAGSPPRASPAP
jgi:tetratricopeptide (TPR) repeat protein